MNLFALHGYYSSGKSLAAYHFKQSFDVIELDEWARAIFIQKKDEIQETFHLKYLDEKELRKELAKKVFSDLNELKKLENILYPSLKETLLDYFDKKNPKKILVVSAVLYKLPEIYKRIDYHIFIKTPLNLIIERAFKRDKISKKEILQRLSAQKILKICCKNSDFIIFNIADVSFLKDQICRFFSLKF